MYQLNDRIVEVTETDFDFEEGAKVIAAYYLDTGAELDDSELDDLELKYQGELYQDGYEDAANAAHEHAEGDR